ncbi:Magnesium and cobalt efflux protein CorC [Fundidesulfovibrio magnetotacticus]|uniref:Magnesium and cobalt efflux protein CorC n=1 Tax=Fundidesulfovibrio magnetotacticus TaxID=2730080 RepID=A0A6V8LXA2_9BACT|nr:hemolysin family protein [Fundidesulfovibrio magnetotacticus]GFK94277.1 Magnesium and cobalt efflux protein CorC [Fundidesulfovibrio magnetotacticus]
MFELVLAIAVALVLSCFCSLSEAVLYSLRWSWIERMRAEGKRSGELLYQMRMSIDKPITAILTVNTMACAAGATVSGALAVGVLGEENLVWFTAAFSVMILVFGEILPKTVGVVYARPLGAVLAQPLRLMVAALTPVVWASGFLTRLVTGRAKGPDASEDDIRAMVRLTSKAGKINALEERSITNILALDTRTVRDAMTPRTVIFSLPSDMTVSEAREENPLWSHSRVPVYEEDDPENIVGVVLRRQVFEALASDQHDIRLASIMQPVQFVLDTMSLDKVLLNFIDGRTHLFVVLDEYGGVSGVITLEDVLEEILGKEIVDETDEVADMRDLARTRREKLLRDRAGMR